MKTVLFIIMCSVSALSQITINGTGSPFGFALKPASADSIQYVTPQGSDSNDGLSLGTAKLTVYAALEALPSGSTNPPTMGFGTVYITDGVNYGGPASGGGVWIMGPADPNYARPPSGWLKTTNSHGTTIQCIAPNQFGTNGHIGVCTMNAGGASNTLPSVWLSGVNNFGLRYIRLLGNFYQAAKIGIDSNNNRNGGGVGDGGSVGIGFEGVTYGSGNCELGGGPSIDIGTNTFWIYIKDSDFSGCIAETYPIVSTSGSGLVRSSNVVTVTTIVTNDLTVGESVTIEIPDDPSFAGSYTVASVSGSPQTVFTYAQNGPNATSENGFVFSDASSAIAINPGTGAGAGLIFVENTNFQGGGIRFTPGADGGGVYVTHFSEEGNPGGFTPPGVTVTKSSSLNEVQVIGLEMADTQANPINVEVDGNLGSPDNVRLFGIAGRVMGPATMLGQAFLSKTVSPRREGWIGTYDYRTDASTDVARRLFSPTAVRFTNLAASAPASWTGSSVTVTATTAPDGTSGAGNVASTSGQQPVYFYNQASQSWSSGDYWIYGAWVESAAGNGYAGGAPVSFGVVSATLSCASIGGPGPSGGPGLIIPITKYDDGQWIFVSGLCKTNTSGSGGEVALSGTVDATHTTNFYGPMLFHIAAGTISDNEAYEIALNLASYGSACSVGTICGLPGQVLHEDTFNVTLNTPASSSATCTAGNIWVDTNFIYVCTQTNTIRRATLSSF